MNVVFVNYTALRSGRLASVKHCILSFTEVERFVSSSQPGVNDKGRIIALPPGILQSGNQQFALVLIKQEVRLAQIVFRTFQAVLY